jgi:hypothetical protein
MDWSRCYSPQSRKQEVHVPPWLLEHEMQMPMLLAL